MKTFLIGITTFALVASGAVTVAGMSQEQVAAVEPVAVAVHEPALTPAGLAAPQSFPWASSRVNASWSPGDDSVQICMAACDNAYRLAVRFCFNNYECLLNALSNYYECTGNC